VIFASFDHAKEEMLYDLYIYLYNFPAMLKTKQDSLYP